MKQNVPTADGHPGGSLSAWMDTAAYSCVIVGYLVAMLTEPHLALPGFALVTIGSVAWLALYRRLAGDAVCSATVAFVIVLGLIGAMTVVLLGSLWGAGYDWLLPMATLGVAASMYSLRVIAYLGSAIWLISSLVMLWISHAEGARAFSNNQLQLLPAFIFVLVFSVVLRNQREQRVRAEALVAQLEEAHRQLRAHANEVEELAIAHERNRMAREIHDTLGHYLTILAVQLETALKLEERGDVRLHDELVEARRATAECLTEVRRSVVALRPADPTARSFDEALGRLVAAFEATLPATEITLDVEGPVQTLDTELRIALYRCVQESLTNVRKHAQATKVLVRMRVDDRQAELTVLDNGSVALSQADGHEPGVGLLGMSERIALLGGVAMAQAEPGRGWRVEVRVPLPLAASSDALRAAPPVSLAEAPAKADSLLSAGAER